MATGGGGDTDATPSADELAELLDAQTDVIWRMQIEPEPRFTYISPSAEEVLGHPPQAFLDDVELWFRMVHHRDLGLMGLGPDAEGPQADLADTLVRYFHADGSRRWAEIRYRRVERDDTVTLFGTTRDVTERIEEQQRIERARRRLSEAEVLVGVGSYDWDVTRDRMWWSVNLFRILGRDPDTYAPSFDGFVDLLLPQHREDARKAVDHAAATGQSFVEDARIRRPDGAVRNLDIIGLVEVGDEGELTRLHGVMRDTTDERAVADARRMFIADAAHELRTPVATLVGAVELLRNRIDSMTGEQRVETLDLLVRQSRRLRELSTSLLDLGALEHQVDVGSMTQVDVDHVIEEVVALHPGNGDVEVVWSPSGLRAMADPWRLERVLVNLVTNAQRFARSKVVVRAVERDDGVVISVSDDGPGVDPETVDGLFQPFHRAATEHGGGSGLGLAIVARLVETMRGTVSYRRGEGGGANFSVRLRHLDSRSGDDGP